jgi:hypothetical protein
MKLIACIYRTAHLWGTQSSDRRLDEIRMYMLVVAVRCGEERYYCKSGTTGETNVQQDGQCACNIASWGVGGDIRQRKQQYILCVVTELLSVLLV